MNTPIGLRIVDDCVTNHKEILDYLLERDEWKRSTVIGNQKISDGRTSATLFLPMLGWNNPSIIHEMNKNVWRELDKYATDFRFSFSDVETVSVQRYEVGDFYAPHTDSGGSLQRIVSAVLYLNDVKQGGETRFTHFDFSVQPVAGRLAIFPSNFIYEHEALPPIEGFKVAAAYWAKP